MALLGHLTDARLTPEEAIELAAQLGDHAFALRLAALTYVQESLQEGLAFETFLARIRRNPLELKFPPELREAEREGVANLIAASLEPLDDAAYDAFLSFGVLPTPSATPELVAGLGRRELSETEDALFALAERGLATRQSAPGSDGVSYCLHDLSHAYARVNSTARAKTLSRAALHYLDAHKTDVEGVELELGNLLGAAERAGEGELVRFMRLLAVDGTYYGARGHSPRSLGLLRSAVEASEGLDDLGTTHYLLGKLGDYYQNHVGDYEKALAHYIRAKDIAQQLEDKGREGVYLGLCGVVCARKNEFAEAKRYLLDAHSEVASSDDLLALCAVLDQMGYVSGVMGEFVDAAQYFSQSTEAVDKLEDSKEISASEVSRRRFFALCNLAEAKFQLGDFEASLELKNKALNIAVDVDNELWMANVYFDLALLYDAIQERQTAQRYFQDALNLYKENSAQAYVDWVNSAMREKGLRMNVVSCGQVSTKTGQPQHGCSFSCYSTLPGPIFPQTSRSINALTPL